MTYRAVVQVPAYREPELHRTLEAITRQHPPPGWSLTFEAWVTPGPDGTFYTARRHPTFDAIKAPEGKLAARNAAHEAAFGAGADAVVTWDADALPAHDDVLEALLRPLEAGGVVATNGNPMAPGYAPLNVATRLLARLQDAVAPHLHGQLSAISVLGWERAGPFRVDDVDQLDSLSVRAEEEFAFYGRLAALGDVVDVREATVYEHPRRTLYRLNKAMHALSGGRYPLTKYGEQRGVETFKEER